MARAGSGNILSFSADSENAEPMPNFSFEIVRAFQDGRDMFIHATQTLAVCQSQWVSMSLIRTGTDGVSSVRHQITSRVEPGINPDPTMIEGRRDVCSEELTESNRARILDFYERALVRRDSDAMREFLHPDGAISHNPRICGSSDGFASYLDKRFTEERPMTYCGLLDMAACGHFVALFARISYGGGVYKACDLIRLEDGFIAEHWDVCEFEPPVMGRGEDMQDPLKRATR